MTEVTYYLYIPPDSSASTPLFVTVHGWSRNVEEHAARFLPFAEQYRVILVAPLFDAKRFPQYGRFGRNDARDRPDHVLDKIVEETRLRTGAKTGPLHLFGFSGGGQFVHRYAMAHPERVERMALGAPGWYTFPDPAQPFPRGIGPGKAFPDLIFDPRQFLKIPVKVLVGELDTSRNHHLKTSHHIDRLQGTNRRERGQRWVQAMTAAARTFGYVTSQTFELLPNSNHSFRRCMEEGGMGKVVFQFLFDARQI